MHPSPRSCPLQSARANLTVRVGRGPGDPGRSTAGSHVTPTGKGRGGGRAEARADGWWVKRAAAGRVKQRGLGMRLRPNGTCSLRTLLWRGAAVVGRNVLGRGRWRWRQTVANGLGSRHANAVVERRAVAAARTHTESGRSPGGGQGGAGLWRQLEPDLAYCHTDLVPGPRRGLEIGSGAVELADAPEPAQLSSPIGPGQPQCSGFRAGRVILGVRRQGAIYDLVM